MRSPKNRADYMRPATIGELLDRAVTLFVQNAWIFVALSAIVYVPLAIVQLSMGDIWKLYLDLLSGSVSSTASATLKNEQLLMQRAAPMELFTVVLMVFVAPLVISAMAHVVFKKTAGEAVTVGEALRFALPRWGRVILFALLWVAALLGAFFALIIGFSLMSAALAFAVPVVALIVMIFLVVMAAVIAGMLVAIVCGGVGMMAVIDGSRGVASAFGLGVALTMNRKMFWRSVLVGLLLFAISLGFGIITSMVGFSFLAALHSGIPMVIINAAMAMVQFGFLTVFMAFFYNDLRARREGADLETLASRLPA